jgi:hypothetical protein
VVRVEATPRWLVALLALTIVSGGPAACAHPHDSRTVRPAAIAVPTDASEPAIAIDPTTWWMESGANASFTAAWVQTPAGCALSPSWFRWSIAPGGSEGALGSTNGSATTFFASDEGTGTTVVVVRAAAALDCRGNRTAAFSRATATVTVAAPLDLTEVGFATNPVGPGSPAMLLGNLSGGQPPYRLHLAWGDGTTSTSNVSGPGQFTTSHAYVATGSFVPKLLAVDSAGRTSAATPDEALQVSSSFAAAIFPSTPIAEVGVPARFTVDTFDSPASFSWLLGCQNAQPSAGGVGLSIGCAFGAPGPQAVWFEAVGGSPPFPVATATLFEEVVAAPSLGFPAQPPSGEVGQTFYAPVEVGGGVPPLTLEWSLVGTGVAGTELLSGDGMDYLPLTADAPGTLLLSVVAVDALGAASAPVQEAVAVVPSLLAWASVTSAQEGGRVGVNVSASAVEGSPPYDWTIVPAEPAVNGSAVSGSLPLPGAFAWNATYRAEGTLNVTVVVVDAQGIVGVHNLSVVLAPPLQVAAEVEPEGPDAVVLDLTILGGLAPFSYRWNDSAGDLWNGTDPAPGSLRLSEATAAHGPLTFRVTVVDAAGRVGTSAASADVLPPPAPPSGSLAVLAAVAVAALSLGGLATLWLRRRRATEPAPVLDPVAVLREAIEPSDGVDRALVELLAEERGLPLEVIRATLERLKQDGRVRSGRGSDGEEVLAWVDPSDR